jgi:hypothetical protein
VKLHALKGGPSGALAGQHYLVSNSSTKLHVTRLAKTKKKYRMPGFHMFFRSYQVQDQTLFHRRSFSRDDVFILLHNDSG